MNGVLQSEPGVRSLDFFLGEESGRGVEDSMDAVTHKRNTCPTLITDLKLPIFAKVCRVLLLVPCVQA